MSHQVHVSHHPLILHKLALLRDIGTPPPAFRRLVRELAQLLFFEATTDLPLVSWDVQTPLAACTGLRLSGTLGVAPILRAGLGMAEAIHDLVPDAQIWHLGLYRDHQTLKPVTYYSKLPPRPGIDLCYIVDPMLATGGSAVAATDILKQAGLRQLRMLAIIAAPDGVAEMARCHPDVPLFVAALDSHLDENKYIVPGLGDAGDRQFGTMV
jgi:uracil phosphoribosyltransferase